MSKYFATYKCPLCGELIIHGEEQDIPYEALPRLNERVVFQQQFNMNTYLFAAPMYMVHLCDGENAGLARFSGFVKKQEN